MKHSFSLYPNVYSVKCPVSRLWNKAKNALSLAQPFSLGFARAKIQRNRFVQGKKKEIRVFKGSKSKQIESKSSFVSDLSRFVSEKKGSKSKQIESKSSFVSDLSRFVSEKKGSKSKQIESKSSFVSDLSSFVSLEREEKQSFFVKILAGWEFVCAFASECPSDETLPRPSQPRKSAIFLNAMSKQKVIVYVDGFNSYDGLKKNPTWKRLLAGLVEAV